MVPTSSGRCVLGGRCVVQVIVAMLKREVLLTKAKLHHLVFEHLVQERNLRSYKAQLKQVRMLGVWGSGWARGL